MGARVVMEICLKWFGGGHGCGTSKFFLFLRCDCLGIHFYLLGTCIKQQFNICSHSAHQSDFRTLLIWTGIAIATLPISTFISVS